MQIPSPPLLLGASVVLTTGAFITDIIILNGKFKGAGYEVPPSKIKSTMLNVIISIIFYVIISYFWVFSTQFRHSIITYFADMILEKLELSRKIEFREFVGNLLKKY